MTIPYYLTITVRTQFIGFHRWLAAPESVEFLRNWHRHVFKVEVCINVDHNNREKEFFLVQNDLREACTVFEGRYFELSCEQICELIAKSLTPDYSVRKVTVSEDGENEGTLHVIGNNYEAREL